MLTEKQEKFVQGLVSGLSQRQAYKRAYNAENMKDETIDERACRLRAESKISARLRELRAEMHEEYKKKELWTREENAKKLRWLMEQAEADIKDKGVKKANTDALINAIKELNAVEAIKIDRVQIEHSTKAQNPLEGMTTEELREMLKGLE